MEAYLEGHELHNPNWKKSIACLMCVVILCGSISEMKNMKSEEYLRAIPSETKHVAQKNETDVAVELPIITVMEKSVSENDKKVEITENVWNEDANIISTVDMKIQEDKPIAEESKKIVSVDSNEELVVDSKEVPKTEIKEVDTDETEKSEEDEGGIPEIVSPFLIDEAGMLYGVNAEMLDCTSGILELPAENCMGIRSNTFINGMAGVYEVYIPDNISVIENGAFTGLGDLFDITVEEGNANYSSIDGVLYGNQNTSLLAFPIGRTGGYIVPEQTLRIEAGAFYQTGLSIIDIRDCGEIEIEDEWTVSLIR